MPRIPSERGLRMLREAVKKAADSRRVLSAIAANLLELGIYLETSSESGRRRLWRGR